MRRIVLAGNPNVGKSLLFSRITRRGAETANYAGTTVALKMGRFKYGGLEYELIDGPGVYSFEEFSASDSAALRVIDSADPDNGDVIVDVVDATNLERNLGLTLQLVALRKPMVLCLNFWDDTKHKGITIDIPALEAILGLPVVATSALDGKGLLELVDALGNARVSPLLLEAGDRWKLIGEIVGKAQRLEHRHHSFLERLSDFTLHPVGGPLSAAFVLVTTLLFVRFIGEGLVNAVLSPLYSRLYAPFVLGLSKRVPWPFLSTLLVGRGSDPLASFGVLTSGIYIALVLVLPYFLSFYVVFGFLEDFGYLPRLAVVLDKIFHRLGLHGYSSIPVMLGLGCKVPALMSTRVLASEREKTLTIALILMSAPCLPQTSMIISLGMNYGIGTVLAVFGALLAIAFLTNLGINKIMKGESAEFFTELPAYRMPDARLFARKLWKRIAEYFAEVLPMIGLGILALNLLDALGVIAFVTEAIKAPVKALLGLPPDIAPIMILGFLRKDVSIALLAPLGLSSGQFVVASVFLALYTPCVAAFFTMARESGIASALRIILLVLVAATLGAAGLHGIFALAGF
jgi:ferrous iron transport protein B